MKLFEAELEAPFESEHDEISDALCRCYFVRQKRMALASLSVMFIAVSNMLLANPPNQGGVLYMVLLAILAIALFVLKVTIFGFLGLCVIRYGGRSFFKPLGIAALFAAADCIFFFNQIRFAPFALPTGLIIDYVGFAIVTLASTNLAIVPEDPLLLPQAADMQTRLMAAYKRAVLSAYCVGAVVFCCHYAI